MTTSDPDREILASSTVTRNYQVTIPKGVRKRFKFERGDVIVFVVEGNRLLIEKG